MNSNSHNSLINGIDSDYLTIDDRSIHYGDGLFETILYDADKLYYWPQHFLRLQSSAERLKLDCPQEQILLDDIAILLEKNDREQSYAIKIIISRGAGERGYRFPKKIRGNRLVSMSAIDNAYSSLLTDELASGDLFICKQQASINETLAGLKHLNRLENVMARNEWDADCIDGLMLNANEHVIEGTMSNLFAVKDDDLLTPDLKLSGVNGVMREIIIDLAGKNNIKVNIKNITVGELKTMDELFISNSLLGMRSVNKAGDWSYSKSTVTKKIFGELLKTRECHAQHV